MSHLYDARPPALSVLFRPGVTYTLNLHWLQAGSLAGRTFTSTLAGDALAVSVDGDTVTVEATDTITGNLAVGSRSEWLLLEDIDGTAEPIMAGMWQASSGPAASRDRTVQVTQGAIEVAVTVVSGGGGGGGGAVASVNGETGAVSLSAADIPYAAGGSVSATTVQAAIAEVAAESGTDAVSSVNGQVGAVSLTAANVGADATGTAATAVAGHADDYGEGAHLPTGGSAGQIPTRGTGTTVAWTDAPVTSVNGQGGAVALDAAEVPFTPAGTIAASTVQAAIEEVAAEAAGGGVSSVNGSTGAVTLASEDIGVTSTSITATDVRAALVEVLTQVTAVLDYNAATTEYDVVTGDPTLANLRRFRGAVLPKNATGANAALWQQGDEFIDLAST
jgi:hypothetical protein